MLFRSSKIRDLEEYIDQWNDSFEFKFVEEKDLTNSETEIFSNTEELLTLIGGRPKNVKEILISETMRMEPTNYMEACGVWEEHENRIVIKRDQLKDIVSFAGTLLHETTHAISGATDITIEFENKLTHFLGKLSEANLK